MRKHRKTALKRVKHVTVTRYENLCAIRQAIADYMRSEGCSCCCDRDTHKEAEARIAKLLHVPKYADKSGYDFGRFESHKED